MIDLHFHLDGAMTLDDVEYLAQIEDVILPPDYKERIHVGPACASLNDYLQMFDIPTSLLQTDVALYEFTKRVLARLADQGLVYVELRFAPQLQTEQGMTQERAVQCVMDAMNEMRNRIDSSLILCYMRHSGNDHKNFETLRLAKKYLHHGVEAVDLAGAEALYKTGNFAQIFRATKEEGIPCTIHAGEADDWISVESAIALGAKRIGHGVRCVGNAYTMKYLEEKAIPLELTPTSEVQTHCVSSLKGEEYKTLFKSGLTLTVNTDNPGISNIDLAHEYRALKDEVGLSEDQSLELMLNAVECAFCSEEVRKRIRHRILTNFKGWYKKNVLLQD